MFLSVKNGLKNSKYASMYVIEILRLRFAPFRMTGRVAATLRITYMRCMKAMPGVTQAYILDSIASARKVKSSSHKSLLARMVFTSDFFINSITFWSSLGISVL